MDIIKNAVKCVKCKGLLEVPVLLPCGECVCKKHIDTSQKEFFCIGCGNNHRIPKGGGFYRIKALENIIKTRVDKINMGIEYNRTFETCKNLENVLNEVNFLKAVPVYHIVDVIDRLKNEVDIKREELKHKIDLESDRIIGELSEYELECKRNLTSQEFMAKSRELDEKIINVKLDLDVWLRQLDNLESNVKKWDKIRNESEKRINDMQSSMKRFQDQLLLNKLAEFELKHIEFGEIDVNSDKLRSKILNMKAKMQLFDMLGIPMRQKWKLLYRASEDDFLASSFHSKCDGQGNTLTIYKSTNGHVFGGYAQVEWDSTSGYKADKNALLFSLVNDKKTPIVMKVNEGKETMAIRCSSVLGPSFGEDDLWISDKSNRYENTSKLGSTFKHPNLQYGTIEAKNFLAGSYYFHLFEIEVFQKIQ